MEIVYTEHAVERMSERKIPPALVRDILLHPDGKIRQSLDKWIFYKRFPERTDNSIAAVAVHLQGEVWEVITVMIHFEVKHESRT